MSFYIMAFSRLSGNMIPIWRAFYLIFLSSMFPSMDSKFIPSGCLFITGLIVILPLLSMCSVGTCCSKESSSIYSSSFSKSLEICLTVLGFFRAYFLAFLLFLRIFFFSKAFDLILFVILPFKLLIDDFIDNWDPFALMLTRRYSSIFIAASCKYVLFLRALLYFILRIHSFSLRTLAAKLT